MKYEEPIMEILLLDVEMIHTSEIKVGEDTEGGSWGYPF